MVYVKTLLFGSMIRSIDFNNGSMLVTTKKGTIYNVSEGDDRKEIMHNHCDGETWGLAVSEQQF